MLTFMPMIGFHKSLRELDNARLEKQRRDAYKLLKELVGKESQHANHPAVWMWQGYEYTLCVYGMSSCSVWQNERGNRDRLAFDMHALMDGYPHDLLQPPWIGDLNFHRSHRSYLIRRDPNSYALKWPNTPENMPILWPQLVDNESRGYRLRISAKEIRLLERGERELPDWLEYNSSRNEVIDLEEE